MKRFTWRCIPYVTALGLAGAAACSVQPNLSLSYRADRPGSGQLSVQVRCLPGDAPYRLRLIGPQSGEVGAQDLRVQLQGRASSAVLDATVQGVTPLLGSLSRDGEVLSGSRTLTFPVLVAAGQWSPAGQYSLALAVVLESVGAP